MGQLIDDYDKIPGWIHQSKVCKACGFKWVECFHMWMKQDFRTWCPKCPEKKATLNNVVNLRAKQ